MVSAPQESKRKGAASGAPLKRAARAAHRVPRAVRRVPRAACPARPPPPPPPPTHLHERAGAAVVGERERDEALRRRAARLLVRDGHALFPQPVDGRLHVRARRGERRRALGDGRARALAQRLDERGGHGGERAGGRRAARGGGRAGERGRARADDAEHGRGGNARWCRSAFAAGAPSSRRESPGAGPQFQVGCFKIHWQVS